MTPADWGILLAWATLLLACGGLYVAYQVKNA